MVSDRCQLGFLVTPAHMTVSHTMYSGRRGRIKGQKKKQFMKNRGKRQVFRGYYEFSVSLYLKQKVSSYDEGPETERLFAREPDLTHPHFVHV